jgi:GntR family transcriptional regulator, transcriptional repressor for pyruvate dehydrogenase complex
VLEPVHRSRIYEEIIEQVQKLIRDGQLKPGDQLPPERTLAEIFKVSRASVREALRALEQRGLIEGKQGGGTFVRAPSAEALIQPLASALLASRRELVDILDVRQMLEPEIARRAAARATGEQLARMQQLLGRQREKVLRGESYVSEDSEFHYCLAVACDNAVLLELLNVIMDLLQESRATLLQSPERARRSLEGHRQILEAVQQRDPEAAYQATLAHVNDIRRGVETLAGKQVESLVSPPAPDAV